MPQEDPDVWQAPSPIQPSREPPAPKWKSQQRKPRPQPQQAAPARPPLKQGHGSGAGAGAGPMVPSALSNKRGYEKPW